MSIKVTSRIWESSSRSGTDLLTLLALADWSDDNGQSYPSLLQLARKVRLSVRQVCHILERLEREGEIRRLRSTGGRNQRTRYVILQRTNSEAGNTVTDNTVTSNTVTRSNKTVLPTSHALNSHKPSSMQRAKDRSQRTPKDRDPRVQGIH